MKSKNKPDQLPKKLQNKIPQELWLSQEQRLESFKKALNFYEQAQNN
jgi:hypothetical protein